MVIIKDKKRITENEDMSTFTVECKMKKRWADQFLSMLNYMSQLGNAGRSRTVSFYADGDGDFRPVFTTSYLYTVAEPVNDDDGDRLYDAG